jgi:hypothetical protein
MLKMRAVAIDKFVKVGKNRNYRWYICIHRGAELASDGVEFGDRSGIFTLRYAMENYRTDWYFHLRIWQMLK